MTLPASGPLAMTDIQTEFGGTNPIGLNEYYAGGGLVPPGTSGTYGAVPSSGALSIQNFYGTSQFIPVYIEELFSTYLYTGNGSTQTITNGIDLAGEGGLVWIKKRNSTANNALWDTNRGAGTGPEPASNRVLATNLTEAQGLSAYCDYLSAFTNSGFTVVDGGSALEIANASNQNYASWTFRKQPKFFDVVVYTGNGAGPNLISHNLGSAPGMVICKPLSTTNFYNGNWRVWHRGNGTNCVGGIELNTTAAALFPSVSNSSSFTATTFDPLQVYDTGFNNANYNGATYVAYLFAHDAGGFGESGTDNVISCGSYTGNGSATGPVVTLGYEPQWVIWKRYDAGTEEWHIRDIMRGMPVTASGEDLYANASRAAGNTTNEGLIPTATGFQVIGTNANANTNGGKYLYIAIRRGPMKVPTLGTSVFTPVLRTGTGANTTITSGHVTDLIIPRGINNSNSNDFMTTAFLDRLRGPLKYLKTNNIGYAIEANGTNTITSFANMTGVNVGSDSVGFCNIATIGYVNWMFRRAPSFFDEVCYSGSNSNTTQAHNLGVVPELIIVKCRTTGFNWAVYAAPLGATRFLRLNESGIGGTDSQYWNNTAPTSSVFSLGTNATVSRSGDTYLAYLFATCPGVSKVGNYTGTGALQTINCGFSSGVRFVLIKRTDASGSWYVWDSARGISSGNDPYVVIMTNTIQVTNTNYVDTTSVGFQVTAAAPADLNASGGTYIFLAIA
jgi:hypothetical protein